MMDDLVEELQVTIEIQQAHIEELNHLLGQAMDIVEWLDRQQPLFSLDLLYAECRN